MRPFSVEHVSGLLEPLEFLEHVWSRYDGSDIDSVLDLADDFRRVANNRAALLNKLHSEFRSLATGKFSQYKQTSILLEGKRSKRPYLRANIWPTVDPDAPNYADLCKAYSYYFPHTHNFSFLTTGYFGPGYETEIWKIDQDISNLQLADVVPMEFQGRYELTNDVVMLYEANRDVHTQYPPAALSISLNLMLYREADKYTTQYFLETNSGRVVGTSSQSPAYRRLTLIRLAEVIGTAETAELLRDVARNTRDDAVRDAATAALKRREAALS